MSVNFFEWIRGGVRQSVLLGVSDAIEQLGTPAEGEELHPGVAHFLAADKESPKRLGATSGGGSGTRNTRKRLGKSLKEIDTSAGN